MNEQPSVGERWDSNPRPLEPQSNALTNWATFTIWMIFIFLSETQIRKYTFSLIGGWKMGLEPTTLGTTIQCSNQLSYIHHLNIFSELISFKTAQR